MLTVDLEHDQVARMMWEQKDSNANRLVMLRAIAREQDPDGSRWEHFKKWFAVTQGEPLELVYPQVAGSVLYGLYPMFEEHYQTANCTVDWWRLHDGVEWEPVLHGRFVCTG